MEEIFIDIRGYQKEIRNLFKDKDYVTLLEFICQFQELAWEVEDLRRELDRLREEYEFVPREPDYTNGDY